MSKGQQENLGGGGQEKDSHEEWFKPTRFVQNRELIDYWCLRKVVSRGGLAIGSAWIPESKRYSVRFGQIHRICIMFPRIAAAKYSDLLLSFLRSRNKTGVVECRSCQAPHGGSFLLVGALARRMGRCVEALCFVTSCKPRFCSSVL